jgi:hypothetical protein
MSLKIKQTALHVLLGVYCYLTKTRPGLYRVYVVLACVVICAGLWCGALYYVARHVTLFNCSESPCLGQETRRGMVSTWTIVGCAMCALSV